MQQNNIKLYTKDFLLCIWFKSSNRQGHGYVYYEIHNLRKNHIFEVISAILIWFKKQMDITPESCYAPLES